MKKVMKNTAIILFSAIVFSACGGVVPDSPLTNNPGGAGSSDIIAPSPGNIGTITASSITANSLVLNWEAATAQLNLVYAVYKSSSNNISTVIDCENNGDLIKDFTTGLLTESVIGLTVSSTYYFNVIVKDSAGNKTVYTMKDVTTTAVSDTTSPASGNSGIVTSGSITHNSLILNWTAGSDNVTLQSDLQYAVYQSMSGNISTVSDCENNGTCIQSYTSNITSKSVSGLSASSTYYFNIIVKDSAENKTVYTMKDAATTTVPDTTAPVTGNSGIITTSDVSSTSLTLNWTAASDNVTAQTDLQYAVYQSASNNISTVSDCENNGTCIQSYTSNITSKAVSGLSANSTYYFNVIVKDSANNESVYTKKDQATAAAVTFNSMGGTSVLSQAVTCGGYITKPANPTKTYWVFAEWYKEEACLNLWDFDVDVVTANTTLFARWKLTIGWAGPLSPLTISGNQGDIRQSYCDVYVDGITITSGQAAGIIAQFGIGTVNTLATNPSWQWFDAAFFAQNGIYDKYIYNLTLPASGNYEYLFRFSGDGGVTWTYGDGNGSGDGLTLSDQGKLTVN